MITVGRLAEQHDKPAKAADWNRRAAEADDERAAHELVDCGGGARAPLGRRPLRTAREMTAAAMTA